jgi:hypothetical protein
MSEVFSLSGPAPSRCESIFIGCVALEDDRFSQVSIVETTVYHSRAGTASRRETRVTSVRAAVGKRNIVILMRNMFAVKL